MWLGKLWLNRQELTAKDFGSRQDLENEGILYVFPIFQTADWEQKIRRSAADDLFRVSLAYSRSNLADPTYGGIFPGQRIADNERSE